MSHPLLLRKGWGRALPLLLQAPKSTHHALLDLLEVLIHRGERISPVSEHRSTEHGRKSKHFGLFLY